MIFEVGDCVWLRLLHQQVQSLSAYPLGKLGPRFVGPFQVATRVGSVAYHLHLPSGTRLHDVFHVGLLKRYGTPREVPPTLPPLESGRAFPVPTQVVRACLGPLGRHGIADATWEPVEAFKKAYLSIQLEDECLPRGGGGVML